MNSHNELYPVWGFRGTLKQALRSNADYQRDNTITTDKRGHLKSRIPSPLRLRFSLLRQSVKDHALDWLAGGGVVGWLRRVGLVRYEGCPGSRCAGAGL
jgi:hypothetical protein